MTKIHLLFLRMSGKKRRGLISLTRLNEILGEFAFQLLFTARKSGILQTRC